MLRANSVPEFNKVYAQVELLRIDPNPSIAAGCRDILRWRGSGQPFLIGKLPQNTA
jgi:hypothetical protein